MAITISFVRGETSLTLPAPAPGATERHERAQATGLTAAGTRVVSDGGAARSTVTLRFESLTDEERAGLLGFFHTTAAGMQQTFTYTDSAGTATTVRFAASALDCVRVAANVHDAAVPLEVES